MGNLSVRLMSASLLANAVFVLSPMQNIAAASINNESIHRAELLDDSCTKNEVSSSSCRSEDAAGLPLKSTRTVNFTSTEGTEMSIDISPDGKTLAFDMLGDIYVMPIAGGDARQITHGLAYDHHPRFSPDGSRLAISSDRSGSENIWIISTDGKSVYQLTRDAAAIVDLPTWSPDAKSIVARRSVPPGADERWYEMKREFWQYSLGAGKGERYLGDPDASQGNGEFGPDGKFLVISSGRYQKDQVIEVIGKADAASSIAGKKIKGIYPKISKSGRWLLYSVRNKDGSIGLMLRDMFLKGIDGSDKLIEGDIQNVQMGVGVARGYAFTPDSESVMFVANGKFHRYEIASTRVVPVPMVAHVSAELAPLIGAKRRIGDRELKVRQLRSFAVSPDGKKTAFGALAKIWISNSEGKPTRLTSWNAREFDPAFSPDGRWLAFVTWSDKGGGRLWRVSVQGGVPLLVADGQGAPLQSPRWLPDSSAIVLVSSNDWFSEGINGRGRWSGLGELLWVSANGGVLRRIETQPFHIAAQLGGPQLTISRDGARVYFVDTIIDAQRAMQGVLRSVRLEGGDEREHLLISGANVSATPSPDGTMLAIESAENVYIAPFESRDGVPIRIKNTPPLPRLQVVDGSGKISQDVRQVTTLGGVRPEWKDDGRTLSWSWTDQLMTAPLAALISGQAGMVSKQRFDLNVSRPVPKGSVLLRGARIITMDSADPTRDRLGSVLERGDILISDNRIAKIGPSESFTVPSGTRSIDVRGKTIIPGLIALHEHTYSSPHLVPDQNWWYVSYLAHGLTTIYSPGSSYDSLTYGEMIESGDLIGPRTFDALDIISPWIEGYPKSQNQADQIVWKHKDIGSWVLKTYNQPDRRQQQWLTIASSRSGSIITGDQAVGLQWQIKQVLDGFSTFEHSLMAPVFDDVAQLLAASGTTYDITPTRTPKASQSGRFNPRFWPPESRGQPAEVAEKYANFPPWKMPRDEAIGVRRIADAGGQISIGTDNNVFAAQPGLNVHYALWGLGELGVDASVLLQMATRNGAHALGLEADLGSIAPGKIADLVVLNSDPLVNITNTTDIALVIKDGVVRSGDTLDEAYPKKKPMPPIYWKAVPTSP